MSNKKEDNEFVMVPEPDGGFHPLHKSQFNNKESDKDRQIERNKRQTDIRKWINELPSHNGWDDEVKNILQYDDKLVRQMEQELDKRARKKKVPEPKIEKVYVDTIQTKQPYLYRSKLLSFFNGDYIKSNEPIKAVRYKGEVILTDGNHRVAISKLKSQKEIEVLITDLDKKRGK